jgi:phage baseplate assembly protein W
MLTKTQNYTDLPFFISSNPFTRDISMINGIASIRQSLKNIVMCNNGERSFDYLFGCSLYSALFENFTYEMMIDVQSKIANNISVYEPRVGINDIRVLNNETEGAISIVIDFHIPEINKNDIIQINLTRTR